ncbi:AMP-binding protein [Patiriisocius sp. Uisw_017]|uniref:AMP-binding protein n=1 Tax=Patiriisocius sp. Uisw_017 TaxID=3230968 RepID=UPI0039EA00F9
MEFNQQLHSAFKFNNISFDNVEDLISFAQRLREDGAPHERDIAKFILKWFSSKDYIKVKTSGSTGKPKKIRLKKEYMINSARATGVYFKMGANNTALLCLPPKFIAGKMMLIRALTMGWDLHVVAPEKDAITQYDNLYDFAAMVPYQVFHSIKSIDKIKKLIIGGGEVGSELEEALQDKNTEAFATYGMTETITHIAVRRINGPGRTATYHALPDVHFETDKRGCLVIDAVNITEEKIITNDLVRLNTHTSFDWLGRVDNVINSGGIKIYPEQVERKLASGIKVPYVIISEKDDALGERLVLVLNIGDQEKVTNYSALFKTLEPFERPKKVYTLSKFPKTKTGKIKRGEIKIILRSYS